MTIGKRFCFNMIVNNETPNLERCLGAIAGRRVLGDGSSTDEARASFDHSLGRIACPASCMRF